MNLIFSKKAFADYLHFADKYPKQFKTINKLLTSILRDPEALQGDGQPEKLKHDLSGFFSRRIDSEHRLVYQPIAIINGRPAVLVASCWGHYDQ